MSNEKTGLSKFWSEFTENKIALISFLIFLLIVFVAIFAPIISPTDPYDLSKVSIMDSRLPPLSENFAGQTFLLGSDGAGRDMLSAIFYGLRVIRVSCFIHCLSI